MVESTKAIPIRADNTGGMPVRRFICAVVCRNVNRPSAIHLITLFAVYVTILSGCRGESTLSSASDAGGRLVSTIRLEPRSFNRFVSAKAPESLIALFTQATLVRV